MNCNPDPTVTCGETYNDSCVNITGTWPACFPTGGGPCYRQSEWNTASANLLCNLANITFGTPFTLPVTLPTGVTSILSSINLTGLTGCTTPPITITPVGTTVAAEFQNIYGLLCQYLPVSLSTPLALNQNPGLNMKCLADPCGVPIATLGGVLQALIDDACGKQFLTYTATLTQTGTTTPVAVVLEDTFARVGITLAWTRTGVGTYTLTPTPAALVFASGKTTLLIGPNSTISYGLVRTNQNTITLTTGGADGNLTETTVEIKVYP